MKVAAIIGSTGLVGSELLGLLSSNPEYSKVYTISRRATPNLPDKLIHVPLDDSNYTLPEQVDVAYCCLGTTMKKAGSKEAFRAVDLTMVLTFAQKAKEAGAKSFVLVSSIGANHLSKNFYLRTKGEVEEELLNMGFEKVIIVRPSLLLGRRNERRLGEDIGKAIYSGLSFIFIGALAKYRAIDAQNVAKAMIVLERGVEGRHIVESNELFAKSKEYK